MVRNGSVVFQKVFVRSRGTVPVIRDVLMIVMEDVKVFIKRRGGNGIEFTRLGVCTVDYL